MITESLYDKSMKAERKTTTYGQIVHDMLSNIVYKNWKFEVRPVHNENGDLFLRVVFDAPDNTTGAIETQCGRWWLIEYGAHPTQVVQCAWLAVQRAEMHEVAEQFTYKGAAIFNRHLDVDELVKVGVD